MPSKGTTSASLKKNRSGQQVWCGLAALLLLISTAYGTSTSPATCDPRLAHIQQQVAVINSQVLENRFNIQRKLSTQAGFNRGDRGLGYYAYFGEGFKRDLWNLPKGQCWVDGGAGEAGAMREYLSQGGLANAVAVGITQPKSQELDSSLRQYKRQFRYIAGNPLEILDPRTFCNGYAAALVTDLFGAFTYSISPDRVLQQYLNLLPLGGKAYIATTEGQESIAVYDPNRFAQQLVTKQDWACSLTGVRCFRTPRGFILEKTAHVVEVPTLDVRLDMSFTNIHPHLVLTPRQK